MLAIRQIVLAAHDLDATVNQIEQILGLQVAYRDPQVAEFGLRNAVMPLGDQFLEVVSPMRAGTAAGRLLERRGDSGYMIILQTDDFERERARLDRLGVRIVWQAAYDDIRAVHLHPKDIGGAIVSLDQPIPAASWRWAGPDWQTYTPRGGAQHVLEAQLEARDPAAMARRWAEVLGLGEPQESADAWRVELTDGALQFLKAGTRGEGLNAFTLAMPAPQSAIAAARSQALPADSHGVVIGGARFRLQSA